MKLPAEVRERFRRYGQIGGRTRARRIDPATRKTIARKAVTARWIRDRFGVPAFSDLNLPGSDIVDQGLEDLAAGRTTLEALLVSLAEPRLRREGVPIGAVEADPERRLYELLQKTDGELAHTRYVAYLRRIVSFADGCYLVRSGHRRA